MRPEHKTFYKEFIENLQSNSLAIFAGAGLSKAAGYVDWRGLLKEIAEDLGLKIEKENDLLSIAQYNENKMGGRSMLNKKIIDEFIDEVELTENHSILARLPIHTYWTTNYDNLIERSLQDVKRVADVKHNISQLSLSRPRRDAVVYKMHGDATMPGDAVLTKDDYERYFYDKAPFVTALSGDLVSKLFVFIGFSFTDPNLDYILNRVKLYMRGTERHHYYFIKKVRRNDSDIVDEADFEYKLRKQTLFIDDLKRFKLQPVFVDSYPEITEILREIELQYKKRTVFISGSAEEYGNFSREDAQKFIHKLSGRLIKENFRIVNGFGWGVGSAVINGALEEIYRKPEKYGEDQLIVKPFPQFSTGEKPLEILWHEYRENMIRYAGVAIYLFGNKKDENVPATIVNADGVAKEFSIASEQNVFQLPIKISGYMSGELADKINDGGYKDLEANDMAIYLMKQLYKEDNSDKAIDIIIQILKQINQ